MNRHPSSMIISAAVLLLLFTSLSCEAGNQGAVDTDAEREAVAQARQAWAAAMLEGDLPALAEMYTAEVVVMPADEPTVVGKEAVDAWYQTFHGNIDITAWSIPADVIEIEGDAAIVRGRGTGTIVPGGAGPVPLDFKFVEVWRKQTDGNWKWSLAIWNSNVRPSS